MKKTVAMLLSLLIVLSIGVICVSAADSTEIYVTISDKDGKIAVAAEKVTVTDTDGDGALTINDALYCAHEAYYPGGAAAGYATATTVYGLTLDKLWGAANGGSYGYYVNGASAWSLTDPVKADDYLYAFVYTDLVKWSDKFSTFDQFKGDVDAAAGVELTLTYVAEYDEYYMPVFKPLAGADILIDGTAAGVKTDENGKAKVTFKKNGVQVVSAKSDAATVTPPVFKATVTGAVEPTEAPTDAATEKATEKATAATEKATADQSNPYAVQTGGQRTVIFVVLTLLVAAFGIVAFKKKHEK